ncbi:MAG: TonB family protein [Rikenellaceae bacterium]
MNKQKNTDNSQRTKQQQDERYILYKKLPFVTRKMTFSRWLEKNSFAAMFTFLFFIFGFVTLVSIRISINTTQLIDGIMIETQPEEKKPEEITEEKLQQLLELEQMLKVSNTIADANADDAKQNEKNRQMLEEAQAIQEKLDANKANYEQGINEIENMDKGRDGKKSDKDVASGSMNNKENSESKRIPAVSKQGNVTVEYDLPGRYATVLPIPAYKCEDGGKVIVSITVNPNGDVISASVKSATASKTDCISTMALDAAKRSRFDVNSSADNKQEGTITYLFLAQ